MLKDQSKFGFVEKSFAILENIWKKTEGINDYLRINLKILNILEDRKAGWVSLKNKHNLMTKDEVNRSMIAKNDGKDKNMIEERKKILINKEKEKKKSCVTSNQFKFKKMDDENENENEDIDEENEDDEYEDFKQDIKWDTIMN